MRLSPSIIATLAVTASAGATHASSFQTLYSFSGSADGVGPYGKLVMDQAGILYGVTVSGGTAQRGNIFSFNPATGVLTSLYSFSGGADGSNPQSGLSLDTSGNLYGVTPRGGLTVSVCSSGCGTVFKLHIATGILTTLYRFNGLADGASPIASPLLLGGSLYGSTVEAGSNTDCGVYGCGTLYRLAISTKTLTTVHNFDGADGELPEGKLVRASAGLLYGSAANGGPHGSGVDFEIAASGAYTPIHGFDYHVDGAYSYADLIIKNGLIYGTMHAGGPTAANDGTIYRLDPSTGVVTTLYSFTGGNDGLFPTYGVVLGANGLLYGPTDQGGADGAGTLFQINPNSSVYKQVHSFAISDGESPSGPLLADPTGALYGLTSGGGRGDGTIFKFVP